MLGGFCPGGFCPRGDFVQGDFVQGDFVEGILSGGGFCPGDFVLIPFSQNNTPPSLSIVIRDLL